MKQRILVIDDDASVCHSLERVLELTGYSVSHVDSSEAGLATLEQDDFDLLVLDLDLPELRGWEILEFAVDHRPDIPVVLLTGLLNQCAAGAFAGTDAVLEKPTEVSLLLQTIATVLQEPRENRRQRLQAGVIRHPLLPGPDSTVLTSGSLATDLPAPPAGGSLSKESYKQKYATGHYIKSPALYSGR